MLSMFAVSSFTFDPVKLYLPCVVIVGLVSFPLGTYYKFISKEINFICDKIKFPFIWAPSFIQSHSKFRVHPI